MKPLLYLATVAALVVAPAATAAPSRAPVSSVRGQLTNVRLHVEGIACDACSRRLREAVTKLDGVASVTVERERAELLVGFDPAKTTELAIRSEVVKHGFTIK